MNYAPTIGLEIHVELKTKTKMFCSSLNDPNEKKPNKNVCPICLGHPGTLPTINKEAVLSVIKVGIALNGTISKHAKFDRKNYFYPDLPKGYQISQYDEPLVLGGKLLHARIRRIHLEEDTGRLQHVTNDNMTNDNEDNSKVIGQKSSVKSHGSRVTLVDFNRAGVPLMELVTEPDFKSGEEVVVFAKELQLILRYLGVSSADMEKGEMRVEANVSLSNMVHSTLSTNAQGGEQSRTTSSGQTQLEFGTKVELKNINSFKAVEYAINYELERQKIVLEGGGEVAHETRGWDDAKKRTVEQRTKEEAHDYRYFPEPDLPPLDTSLFDLYVIQNTLPELPDARRKRFVSEYALSEEQASALVEDENMANFYEQAESELAQYENEEREKSDRIQKEHLLLFNYLVSDLRGLINEAGVSFQDMKISPENFAELIDFIADGEILSRQAKDILAEMFETGSDPTIILNEKGLHTVHNEQELETIVHEVIAENPAAVSDYKKGKHTSIQFLIGKAMGKLQGRGNPEILRVLFTKILQ